MIIRSKAPLRLGLAGGGTDVSPYCDLYGGYVLNATINLYAYCTLIPTSDNKIVFRASDRDEHFESESTLAIPITQELILHKGVYNRIVKDFNNNKPLSLRITSYADVPAGSGLGSSSTMVVALIRAYTEWLNLPLGEYDMAHLAYQIERVDLGLSGGKQDQYAATFGGLNFMEFYKNDKVIVNPLRIKNWIKNELENSLLIYFMGVSRESAEIIDEQIKNTQEEDKESISAMHSLKDIAVEMKEAILKADFDAFASSLNAGWNAKKQMASQISNKDIDEIYEYIMQNGGKAAKVSGAGGGGFMMIVVDPEKKYDLIKALKKREGVVFDPNIVEIGSQGWTIY